MTLIKNNRGQGMTEYLVLLMLVAVASISTVVGLGGTIRAKIKEAKDQINKQVTANVGSEKGQSSDDSSSGSGSGLSGVINGAVGGALGALSGDK